MRGTYFPKTAEMSPCSHEVNPSTRKRAAAAARSPEDQPRMRPINRWVLVACTEGFLLPSQLHVQSAARSAMASNPEASFQKDHFNLKSHAGRAPSARRVIAMAAV